MGEQQDMVVCPKFGHLAQSLKVKKKSLFLHAKNNLTNIVNGTVSFELFQLSNGDFYSSMPTADNPKITNEKGVQTWTYPS